jgi:hypothetical protein
MTVQERYLQMSKGIYHRKNRRDEMVGKAHTHKMRFRVFSQLNPEMTRTLFAHPEFTRGDKDAQKRPDAGVEVGLSMELNETEQRVIQKTTFREKGLAVERFAHSVMGGNLPRSIGLEMRLFDRRASTAQPLSSGPPTSNPHTPTPPTSTSTSTSTSHTSTPHTYSPSLSDNQILRAEHLSPSRSLNMARSTRSPSYVVSPSTKAPSPLPSSRPKAKHEESEETTLRKIKRQEFREWQPLDLQAAADHRRCFLRPVLPLNKHSALAASPDLPNRPVHHRHMSNKDAIIATTSQEPYSALKNNGISCAFPPSHIRSLSNGVHLASYANQRMWNKEIATKYAPTSQDTYLLP